MNKRELFLLIVIGILIIVIWFLIIYWPTADTTGEYMYLKVIKMIEHEEYEFNYRVIMKSEDNQIITVKSFEIFNLVKVGDIINAKVKLNCIEEWDDTKYYDLSDIQFIKE